MYCAYHTKNPAAVQCQRCARALCPACDHRIKGFPYCQECIVAGVDLLQQQAHNPASGHAQRTSPLVALLLSIVPGLGAAYNGQTSKALVHFAIFASLFQMATVTDGQVLLFPLGVVGIWLYAAVDAFRTAQLIRAGLHPQAAEDAIARRLYGNPLAWSLTLLTLGIVFLLRTLFGFQLPVDKILPALLVALGAYMLYDFVQRRRDKKEVAAVEPSLPPAFANYGTLEAARFGVNETTRLSSRATPAAWPVEPRN